MNHLQLQNINITIQRLPFGDCSNLLMNERNIKKNRNKSDCNPLQAKELKVVLEKTFYSKLTKKSDSCVDENKPIPNKMLSTKTDTKSTKFVSNTRLVLNKSKRASNKTSPINLTKVNSKNKNIKVVNDVQECTLPAQRLRKNNCMEGDSKNKNIDQRNINFRKNRHKSDSNPQQAKELKVVLERTVHSRLTKKNDACVDENKQTPSKLPSSKMDTKSTKCVSDIRFGLNKSKNASNNTSQINCRKVDPKKNNKKVDNVVQEGTLLAEHLERNNCTKVKNKNKNVGNAVRECTLPVQRLRKNNFVDYCELSINEFKPPSLDKNHIPVYNQKIPDEILPEPISEDPYALDVSDSSQPIKKKKKSKATRNGNKKIKKPKPTNKKRGIDYNTMVNNIVKTVMTKINNKKIVNTNTPNLDESVNISLKEADVIPVDFVSDEYGTNKCGNLINGDSNRVENSGDGNRVENSEELLSHTLGNDQNRFNNSAVITDTQFLNESQKISQLSNIAISSQSPVLSNSSAVNIISNINVTSTPFHYMNQTIHNSFVSKNLQNNENFDDNHQDSYEEDSESEGDRYFGFTLESERPRKRIGKPWRLLVEYKRNRHILLINKNGLPCKCQDLVIDYELVKRMGWNTSTKPIQSKPLEQRTMLNYIQTSQNHQIVHVSLYNYEEFNISPRKPLREIHNNNQLMSTPKRNINFNMGSPNVSIIPHEENIENVNITHHETPRKDYTRQSIFHKTTENENEGIEDDDQKEDDYDDVGLFDDIEVNENVDFDIELPKLKFHKGKRVRANSEDCKHDDHHEKKSKKKKKNDMTKAEMAEFEAWASKINARFEEDDKHELTIM